MGGPINTRYNATHRLEGAWNRWRQASLRPGRSFSGMTRLRVASIVFRGYAIAFQTATPQGRLYMPFVANIVAFTFSPRVTL
jgi:hypothetical protein